MSSYRSFKRLMTIRFWSTVCCAYVAYSSKITMRYNSVLLSY